MLGPAGIDEGRTQASFRPIAVDRRTEPPRERERHRDRRARLHVGVVNGQVAEANNAVSRPITAARQRSER